METSGCLSNSLEKRHLQWCKIFAIVSVTMSVPSVLSLEGPLPDFLKIG